MTHESMLTLPFESAAHSCQPLQICALKWLLSNCISQRQGGRIEHLLAAHLTLPVWGIMQCRGGQSLIPMSNAPECLHVWHHAG